MESALKLINFTLKMTDVVLKTDGLHTAFRLPDDPRRPRRTSKPTQHRYLLINVTLKLMDFTLKLMGFTLQLMGFILKLMVLY